jgi:hypothetical protein
MASFPYSGRHPCVFVHGGFPGLADPLIQAPGHILRYNWLPSQSSIDPEALLPFRSVSFISKFHPRYATTTLMAFLFFKALLAIPPWVTPSPHEVLAPLQGFSAVSDGLSLAGTPSFLKFLPFSLVLPMRTRGIPRLLIPRGYDQIVTDLTDYPLRHSRSEPDRSLEVQAFAATDSLVKAHFCK